MKEKKVKHSVKRVISAVLTFCLIILITLSLVVVVKTTLADDPSVLGFRFFYIISGSMEPTIPVSAAVITKRQAEYAVGDVITFRSSDAAILDCPNTHRIVNVIVNDGQLVYQTQGDANSLPDAELVPFDDVFGKVVCITPPLNRVGEFLEFLLTPSGFFVLLVIPMLLLTVVAMKEFAKNCQAALRQQAEQLAAEKQAEQGAATQTTAPAPQTDLASEQFEQAKQAQQPKQEPIAETTQNEKGSGN